MILVLLKIVSKLCSFGHATTATLHTYANNYYSSATAAVFVLIMFRILSFRFVLLLHKNRRKILSANITQFSFRLERGRLCKFRKEHCQELYPVGWSHLLHNRPNNSCCCDYFSQFSIWTYWPISEKGHPRRLNIVVIKERFILKLTYLFLYLNWTSNKTWNNTKKVETVTIT